MANDSILSPKIVSVLGLSIVIVIGLSVVVFFPNLLLPDRLEVDGATSTQDLLDRYNALIRSYISGEEFSELDFPVREQIIDEIDKLNKELAMDIEMTEVDPNKPLNINENGLSEPCTSDCQNSPEVVNPCAGVGFIFVENLGCISEPIAEIIEVIELTFDPLLPPATKFEVLSKITLTDSSGEKFEESDRFEIPLTSLIARSGSILDLATVNVRLTGISDSSNPIKTEGTLNYKINGESIRGIPIITTAVPNQITSAFDIKINNKFEDVFSFQGVTGLMSGAFANNFEITLRDFKVTQGNVTFAQFGEVSLYDLDFTFDQGKKTVIGSTGTAVAVPITDGEFIFCTQVRKFEVGTEIKIVGGVQTTTPINVLFIPDKPTSITVRMDTGMRDEDTNEIVYSTIIPSFTVDLRNPTSNARLVEYCEERNGIPRSSTIQFVVKGIDFGTGTGNEIQLPETIFEKKTGEGKPKFRLDCLSGDVDIVTHWCNSDFGFGHGRVSTEVVVPQ